MELRRVGVEGTTVTGRRALTAQSEVEVRRRQDVAPLPARKIAPRTTGRVYTAPDGRKYRPSMFLTLTCDSYGKILDDGIPADPGSYDYTGAARDAIHFAALVDRFIQNLRRVLGYEAQYFGAVEPQKRLAPHIHLAVRGSVPRPLLRQVLAATYHQVWWSATDTVRFAGDQLPVWDEDSGNYLDPATGEILHTWDAALDAIGPDDAPRHVARFRPRFNAQGVLAGSKDADRCIGYLTKYLTKQVADCHMPETAAQRVHADRADLVVIRRHASRPGLRGPRSVRHAVLNHAHGPIAVVPAPWPRGRNATKRACVSVAAVHLAAAPDASHPDRPAIVVNRVPDASSPPGPGGRQGRPKR